MIASTKADVATEEPAPTQPASWASSFIEAARDAGVIWAGLFALGIGFGVLTTSHGLPWWSAAIISATLFAGSVEFILVGMLAVSAPISAIALTTLLANCRHVFYGLSFPLNRVRGRLGRVYCIFALCDEAYALLASREPHLLTAGRILWTQVGLHSSWALGALVGGAVGGTFLADLEGLEFILTALFIVLTMDAYRANPDRITFALAVAAALVARTVAPGSMVIVAMVTFTASLIARHLATRPSP
ncbi:MAG: AzlC family ABC transporter permease, partial [Gammaproteobacteria bacterium]